MILLCIIQLIGFILLLITYKTMEKKVEYVVSAEDDDHSLLMNDEDGIELLRNEHMEINEDGDTDIYNETEIQ